MKTKLNKITIGSILGVLAIAILAAIAWSTVASNAFATDEEASTESKIEAEASADALPVEDTDVNNKAAEEQPNETALVNFSFKGLDAGVVPEYVLTKGDTRIEPYNPSDPITVNVGATVDISKVDSYNAYCIKIHDASTGTYDFTVYSPIGYDVVGVAPTITTITGNQTFEISFAKYEGKYSIEYRVAKSGGVLPISGVKIDLRLNNWDFIESKTTDSEGKCSFTLSKENAVCLASFEKEGYLDSFANNDARYYTPENNHTYSDNVELDSVDTGNVFLSTDDPAHKYFELKVIGFITEDPTQVMAEKTMRKESIASHIDNLFDKFIIADDGALYAENVFGPITMRAVFSGVCEEGYNFDHWTIDLGDGVKKDYRPGDTFDYESDTKIIGGTFYKANEPGPGPEPTPTPSEEVNATAQTGDSTATLPFAILAASCAIVLIARRKFN